jgi:hypothetical protein
MPNDVQTLYEALTKRAQLYGITVRQAELKEEVPGEFDGPTITLNQEYDASERAFYLAHSIGSIAEWSLHFERSKDIVRELRKAKEQADSRRLERALDAYLAFEQRTWDFADWLLEQIKQQSFVAAFANFGRADMAAMRVFHATGKAPVWREFFAAWNEAVRTGRQEVPPFLGRAIPEFQAVRIPKQEIVQEDGREEDGGGR